jgi:hypothetical protein
MTTNNKYPFDSRKLCRLLSTAALVLLLAGMASCKNEDDNYINTDPGVTVQIANNGAETLLSVNANVDWSFNTDDDWLTGTVTAGGILLRAMPNPNFNARQTFLHLVSARHPAANKSVPVIQDFTFFKPNPSVIPQLDAAGAVVNVAVETNITDWTVNAAEAGWLTVAKSNGGFTLTASKNEGRAVRSTEVVVSSTPFKLERRVLEISQGANFIPYLNIEPSDNLNMSWEEGTATVEVTTNVDDWAYSPGSNWIQISKTGNILTLTIAANQLKERTTTLQFTSVEFPDVNKQLRVTQSGFIVFEEDFSFLTGGMSDDIFIATNEKRFDSWATTYGTTNGWTSTPSPDQGGTVAPWIYSRNGYPKFGKTSYNGDLITPKLSAIEGVKNIQVTFKACGYTSAGNATTVGTRDPIQYTNGATGGHADVPNELNIEIIGPGTASQTQFIINNYPDDNRRLHGPGWLWQMDPAAIRTFVITGATADTQIRFIAGKKVGISTNDGTTNGTYYTYRHGLDDVLIHLIE